MNISLKKFTLQQDTKALGRAEVQLYSFFHLYAVVRWVVNATPQPLYPWERETVPNV